MLIYNLQIEEINEQIRREKEEAEARMRQATKSSEKSTTGGGGGSKNWPEDDLQLLIKAVNLFPAGTNSRYFLRLVLKVLLPIPH